MLSRSVPIDANQRDSARVEKRGPLTTVTVPPSSTVTPSARQARQRLGPQVVAVRVGERDVVRGRPVEERAVAAAGPVDELVGDHERASARGRPAATPPRRARRPGGHPASASPRRWPGTGPGGAGARGRPRAGAGRRPGVRRPHRSGRAPRSARRACRRDVVDVVEERGRTPIRRRRRARPVGRRSPRRQLDEEDVDEDERRRGLRLVRRRGRRGLVRRRRLVRRGRRVRRGGAARVARPSPDVEVEPTTTAERLSVL